LLLSFTACVARIAEANAGNGKVPGAEFDGSGHLQVAGVMLVADIRRFELRMCNRFNASGLPCEQPWATMIRTRAI
jgi:hypothetical protein